MSAAAERQVLAFGEFFLDATQRLLFRADGEPVALVGRAFDTLLFMVEHPVELLDKKTLMHAIWPDVIVEENNLSQNIFIVRRALGEAAGEHRFIVTVPGRGFRFVAPVRRLDAIPQPGAPAELQPAESQPASTALEQEAAAAAINGTPASTAGGQRSRVRALRAFSIAAGGVRPAPSSPPATVDTPLEHRFAGSRARIALWGLAGIALALIAGSFLWFFARPTEDSTPTSAAHTPVTSIAISPAVAKPRLAILPFENLSPDPANAFFADGLHEEILSTIAQRVLGLEVISRTTMMSYRRDPPTPLAEVARELGASHLIEGSVRREANKVRLTLQLIDARTDVHLWSQNYDRTLTDALTLQSDVASEVASQLSLQLVGGPQSALPLTRSPEAYDLYLKAKLAGYFLNPFTPVERYRDFENLLNRAIALDPSFALAYASRSTFRGVMFAWNYDVSEEWVRRIREDVDAGLRLAPHEPIVLAAEALYWSWIERDLPRALAIFESADMASLADPMFLSGKSALLLRLRRVDEAVGLNERLMALDPGNPFIRGVVAGNLVEARRTAEVLQFVNHDASLQYLRARVIFANTGRTDEWRAALDQANETISDPVTMLDENFLLLTFEHRYADLQKLLDDVSVTSTRVNPLGSGYFFGVGQRPIAEYRAWTALLLKDSSTAGTQGRAVLEFVANQKETKWNAWFLQLLTAEGFAFLGQRERAIAAARKTLELMPPSRDAMGWVSAAGSAAAVYAWAGAQDEAVALLEELSTVRPGLRPASITRSPIYAIPLAKNPRYQALVSRLEAQMRRNRAALIADVPQ